MENGEPDKQALELIRQTETALATKLAETEKSAHAILMNAQAEAERIVREKENELAQALRQAGGMDTGVLDPGPAQAAMMALDPQSLETAEKIAQALFDRIIRADDGEGR